MKEIIDIEDAQIVKRKVACIYHADADGFGSAYALNHHLKDTCDILFIKAQYGDAPPVEQIIEHGAEEVYIVDFSYKSTDLLHIDLQTEAKVVVIDHHKTALPELKVWGGEYAFDIIHSGCVLTWHYFDQDGNPPPDILLYVQDRDLWRFDLEHSREINAFIATMDEDFEVWDDFYTPEAYDCGRAILKFQAKQMERRLDDVAMLEYGKLPFSGKFAFRDPGTTALVDPVLVPVCNASENISEFGEYLNKQYPEAPFSMTYCDRSNGIRSYSLRSKSGFDVSVVAKAFGGGGHAGAAGFSTPSPKII